MRFVTIDKKYFILRLGAPLARLVPDPSFGRPNDVTGLGTAAHRCEAENQSSCNGIRPIAYYLK